MWTPVLQAWENADPVTLVILMTGLAALLCAVGDWCVVRWLHRRQPDDWRATPSERGFYR